MSQAAKIPVKQVLEAYNNKHTIGKSVEVILMDQSGLSEKECYSAMQKCCAKDYVEYGVSLRHGWLTQKGIDKLRELTLK